MPKPDVKAIAARLILLNELQSHAWFFIDEPTPQEAEISHQRMLADLRKYGLWSHATNVERELLETPPLALGSVSAEGADIYIFCEEIAVFAWCLGMIEGLPPFDTRITDDGAPYSKEFSDNSPFSDEFEYVADNYMRRPEQEIEKARDEAELWHWRSRTLGFQRDPPPFRKLYREPPRCALKMECL
jgi:hypothetical protein